MGGMGFTLRPILCVRFNQQIRWKNYEKYPATKGHFAETHKNRGLKRSGGLLFLAFNERFYEQARSLRRALGLGLAVWVRLDPGDGVQLVAYLLERQRVPYGPERQRDAWL